jgi:hypothetical protein
MAMVTSSLRPSPFTLHSVSRRSLLSTASRRNPLTSIRLKSSGVSQAAKGDTLPWSDYLTIRRGKRKWEMACLFSFFSFSLSPLAFESRFSEPSVTGFCYSFSFRRSPYRACWQG